VKQVMRHMRWSVIALALAVAVAATGVAGASAATKKPHKASFKGSIKIGLISDFTGDLEVASNYQGALAYFDYVNAHGGVDGYKIVPKEFDAQSSPTAAVQAVRQAIAYKPAGIVGASFVIGSGLPTLASSGVPTVGDGFVAGWTGHKNLFPVDGDLATHESIVDLLIAKKYGHSTKVAFIGSAIDAPQQKVLINHAADAGITFVMKDFSEQLVPTSPEYLSMAQQIKASGAGAVVDFGIENMAALQTDLNQLGASNVKVIGSDIPPASTGANGLLYGLPWATNYVSGDPGIKTYVKAMKGNGYGSDIATGAYAPFRWAQAALLVQGLEAAGPPFKHPAVVKAMSHIKGFTANGIIAPASFPAYQKVGGTCDGVGQIVNGQWKSLISGAKPFICAPKSLSL
jgi:ABC-type branched-subunit amino acid transport system substrate-binding protein